MSEKFNGVAFYFPVHIREMSRADELLCVLLPSALVSRRWQGMSTSLTQLAPTLAGSAALICMRNCS